MRTGDVDIVDIEADAGLETPQGILLADPADEGGQGGVGAAGNLQRQVRRGPLKRGDVAGAAQIELFARIHRHRDRNVDLALRAPSRRDDYLFVHVGSDVGLRLLPRRGACILGGGGSRGPRD